MLLACLHLAMVSLIIVTLQVQFKEKCAFARQQQPINNYMNSRNDAFRQQTEQMAAWLTSDNTRYDYNKRTEHSAGCTNRCADQGN